MPTLDTTFLVDLIRGNPEAIAQIETLEEEGGVPATTVVNILELYKGAYLSGDVRRNLQEVEALRKALVELTVGEDTYPVFGALGARLRQEGRPVGDFDELIAALTLCNDGIIITRNQHFSGILGLTVAGY